MSPRRPYYFCIFDGPNKNKEDLKSYKYILKVQFSGESSTCLDMLKIIYAGGSNMFQTLQKELSDSSCGEKWRTYPNVNDRYFCKVPIDFTDPNICGQLEQTELTEEPYLCMETVDHLFETYTPPQGLQVYIVRSRNSDLQNAFTILEVQHKYLTTFKIKRVLVNTYEWMCGTRSVYPGDIEIFYPNAEDLTDVGFSQTFPDRLQFGYESISIVHGFQHGVGGYTTQLISEEAFQPYRHTLFPLSLFLKDRVTKLYLHFLHEWHTDWAEMEKALLEAGITQESLEILDTMADALLSY